MVMVWVTHSLFIQWDLSFSERRLFQLESPNVKKILFSALGYDAS